jgi:hypothetical protein
MNRIKDPARLKKTEMNPLHIPATASTPAVTLDKEKGIFSITGRSLPEDSLEFYQPVLRWFSAYLEEPNRKTTVEFRFEYINTISVKVIQQILSSLEGVGGVLIRWHSGEEDEDIAELGHQFAEIQRLTFEFLSY